MTNVKADLPIADQRELERILDKDSSVRTQAEIDYLNARREYLVEYTPGLKVEIGEDSVAEKKDNSLVRGVAQATPVNSAAASGTITGSDEANATDGKTVTIDDVVYTLVSELTTDPATVPYEVLIGETADDTLGNLQKAINGSGEEGVDYSVGTKLHPMVSCGDVTAHVITLTARYGGEQGNVALSTDEATYTVSDDTLTGGVDGTPGVLGQILSDGDALYVAVQDNSIEDAVWKMAALSDLS